MKRCLLVAALPAVAALVTTVGVFETRARDEFQHWNAFSLSAEGITGNIDISDRALVFSDGQSLMLSYVGESRGVALAIGDPMAKIYKISNPKIVHLMHGNPLCAPPPTYLAVARSKLQGSELLFLTLISGAPIPRSDFDKDRICASYAFIQQDAPR